MILSGVLSGKAALWPETFLPSQAYKYHVAIATAKQSALASAVASSTFTVTQLSGCATLTSSPGAMVLLPSGGVLISGAISDELILFDPVSNATTTISGGVPSYSMVLCDTGEVLIASSAASGGALKIYNPASKTLRSSSVALAKPVHHMALAPNGQVVLMIGEVNETNPIYVYDPATDTVQVGASVANCSRVNVLSTGAIYVSGNPDALGYFYDIDADSLTGAGAKVSESGLSALTMLADGRLIDCRNLSVMTLISADAAAVSTPAAPRLENYSRRPSLLPDGRLLRMDSGYWLGSYIWNPVDNGVTGIPNMSGNNWMLASQMLPDGRVLVWRSQYEQPYIISFSHFNESNNFPISLLCGNTMNIN